MLKRTLYVCMLCVWCNNLLSQSNIIKGIVADSISSEPLYGARVFTSSNKSVQTSENGEFSINISTSDSIICVSYLGYQTQCISTRQKANFNFKMHSIAIQTQEIEILANATKQVESINTGYTELSRKELSKIPALLGERDPIKALQFTPGISKSEAGQNFIVRGGAADQNLILIDGATVFNPSHLLGIFSVFNPLNIQNVKMIKAGMPVEYGGRLSSILDVETSQPDLFNSKCELNLGLLMSNVYYSTPLIKNKIALTFSIRKSYIDQLIKPVLTKLIHNKTFKSTTYNFTDFNAKLLYQINSKNQFNISCYLGSDQFGLKQDILLVNNTMEWQNKIYSLQWRYYNNQNFKATHTLYRSEYNLIFDARQDAVNFNLKSAINESALKSKYEWMFENTNFLLGHEAVYTEFSPFYSEASTGNVSSKMGTSNIFNIYSASAFVSLEKNISEKLLIYIGIRTNLHTHLGPYTRYLRDFQSNISDTILYKKNQLVFKHIKPEFRFSLRYLLNTNSSLKMSYTDNYQTFIQVSPTSVSMPTDFWVPSTNSISPQKSRQISFGFYQYLDEKQYEVSLETYIKEMTNQTEVKNGLLNTISKNTFEENLIFGRGIAYGGEVFLTKKNGVLTGWISYTLARSMRAFKEINNGDYYPSKYDRIHDFSLVSNYKMNEKWSFSGVFIFATGNAFTLPNGRYIIQGNLINQYGRYNSYRLPPYHRLDLSATLTLKKWRNVESEINFSIYNIYNRNNPFYIYVEALGNFDTYNVDIRPASVALLPLLPSITYIVKF